MDILAALKNYFFDPPLVGEALHIAQVQGQEVYVNPSVTRRIKRRITRINTLEKVLERQNLSSEARRQHENELEILRSYEGSL